MFKTAGLDKIKKPTLLSRLLLVVILKSPYWVLQNYLSKENQIII